MTGAARGIGAATVSRLRADGLQVVGVDVDPVQHGVDVHHVTGDVRDPAVAQAAVAAATAIGPLRVLVNNAGIVRDRAFTAQTDQDWATVLSTVLEGTRTMTAAVVAAMQSDAAEEMAAGPDARPTARRIVLTAPAATRTGTAGSSASAAAGGAVVSLAATLARELGGWGIRVNTVMVGHVRTRLTDRVDPGTDVDPAGHGLPEPVRQMAAATTALGRFGDPEEVAAVHAFLSGPDSDYVTGAVIPVTGGLLGT